MSLSATRSGAYVAQNVFEVPPEVDIARLRESWATVIQMNDILRTRIMNVEELFYQVVTKEQCEVSIAHGSLDLFKNMASDQFGLGRPLNQFQLIRDGAVAKDYFLWTCHHSTYDGYSIRIILEQWEQIYKGLRPQPLVPFQHFVRHTLQDKNESASFWMAQAEDHEFATFPPLPAASYQPVGHSVTTARVTAIRAESNTTTLSTYIRAAWAIVLGHWCQNQDAVVMGSVLAGRSAAMPGVDRVAGPTLATNPIVIAFRASELVIDFLDRVQRQWLEMIAHEQFGLQNIAKLSEACKRATQFQNLLAIQPAETSSVSSDEIMRLLPSGDQDSEFYTYGLTVQCFIDSEGFDLKVNFDSVMMSQTNVRRLVEQLSCVVQQLITATGDQTVESIDILPASQREQVMAWNSPEILQNDSCCTDWRIARVAVRHPQRAAVCSSDLNLTYSELMDKTCKLAIHLRDVLGLGRGSLVPVCFEKSAWAVISQLAIIRIGAAFVPLDPRYPADRMQRIFDQTGASHVLCSANLEQNLRSLGRQTTIVNELLISGTQVEGLLRFEDTASGVDELMYVLFTSGSTGVPKGVAIENRAFDASSQRFGPGLGLNDDSRVLQFANFVFDASVLEIFSTLSFGGCVCIPSDAERMTDLSDVIKRLKVNWAFFTPSVLRTIDSSSTPGLKTLVVGSEPVGKDTIRAWARRTNLYEAYGPTETAVISSAARIPFEECEPHNIGKPFNFYAWVVSPNNHNRLSALGCIGELLIYGPTLARGYLQDDAKTAAAFIDPPEWASAFESQNPRLNLHQYRYYKTGDLVSYATDGSLVIYGRKDTQVKVG